MSERKYYIGAIGCFQPYTRMTQRSKWADPRAKAYLDSQEALAPLFAAMEAP